MRTLVLREEEATRVSREALDEGAALRLYRRYGRYIDLEFPGPLNGGCYILRPRSYAGHLPAAGELLIDIQPKVPLDNLFGMLEYAYGLESFHLFERTVPCGHSGEVFEQLAAILAARVMRRVRCGLRRDYVERRARLPFVRGRVLPASRPSTAAPPRCLYQEYTADVADNRILAWTLYSLRRFPFRRREIKRGVRQAFRAVVRSVELGFVSAEECRRRGRRAGRDYRCLHALCRFFLEHSGPGPGAGERECAPFVVHMPTLFEAFVAAWLRERLGAPWRVEAQQRTPLEGSGDLAFQIDLVLREAGTGKVAAVLDTKYRRGEEAQTSHIQQVVAYAVRMGTNRAVLVYPSRRARGGGWRVGGVRVHSLGFDLSRRLEEAGEDFLGELLDAMGGEEPSILR